MTSVYPNPAGSNTPTLSEAHSGALYDRDRISRGVAEERGTFSARRGRDVPQDRGRLPERPGIVFPVHTLDGGLLYRLRLDKPGRGAKYMQPKGVRNRLDVHPGQHERIRRPGGTRYVTEGEKKVDAGVSRGLLMVGMSGVWNGQRDGALIPDWDLLPLDGERYVIAFDSDILTNPNVQGAADRMARLLGERGAEVLLALVPPAPDGSKQGLDDFFAAGGTVKELELLTQPYREQAVKRARLSRDERLRLALRDLRRRWWAEEWSGQGAHSDRDVYAKLIEAAERHGRVVGGERPGVRVEKAWGPLEVEARVSRRTLAKALRRLEERGVLYRDNEGRPVDRKGAFVLRAGVNHNGRASADGGTGDDVPKVFDPGGLHLRAPRLMWSSPGSQPRRGTVRGTRKPRQGPPPEPRPAVKRLGKIRGAILDVLDAAGGTATLAELCGTLHRKRPRDLRRRLLPMLEEAGIVSVNGDRVSLAADWLDRLEEARELGGEIEAEYLARVRMREKSEAFRNRHKARVDPAPTEEEMDRRREAREEDHHDAGELVSLSPLAAAVDAYLRRSPHDATQAPGWIAGTLWAYELYPGKPTPAETRAALAELGGDAYRRKLMEGHAA